MEQYTFDGTVEEINFLPKDTATIYKRLTIKQKFRLKYGINENVRCKDCKYFKKINVNGKHYYKCEIMGISSSSATDIRLKDHGCSKFMEGGENIDNNISKQKDNC